MLQEKALAAISFKPRQLSKDDSPFPIRKKSAVLRKSDKPSEIIELDMGVTVTALP